MMDRVSECRPADCQNTRALHKHAEQGVLVTQQASRGWQGQQSRSISCHRGCWLEYGWLRYYYMPLKESAAGMQLRRSRAEGVGLDSSEREWAAG